MLGGYIGMANIKSEIRNISKYFPFYQRRRAESYFTNEICHCNLDAKDRRICYFHGSKSKQQASMLKMINIQLSEGARFQSWIDTGLYTAKSETMIDNIPPNYEAVVYSSIDDIIGRFVSYNNEQSCEYIQILNAIKNYIDRICFQIDEIDPAGKDDRLAKSKLYYQRMITNSAESLEEALQRIVFWSDIFWQSHHRLVGLGRLDYLLDKIELQEDDSEILKIITDFYDTLHKNYAFKSNKISKGDTGQIIIVGGLAENGVYFSNRLTYLLIEALSEHNLPDPKILLRVSSNMPEDLLRLGVRCVSTGTGCPLLSNDDVVIPAIEKFGYTHSDACNYVTSACWEPLPYGKALEKNNLADINFAKVIVELYHDAHFCECRTFDDVVNVYLVKLKEEVNSQLKLIDSLKWEEDPLMSMFTDGCIECDKDISKGGAKYNDYGILTVGLANAVDSLLNIKRLCFEENTYSLSQLVAVDDINNQQVGILKSELSRNKYYGRNLDDSLQMTNLLTDYVRKLCINYRNKFGGKVKWGLSSPNYVECGKITGPTLDGREKGAPLAVHISASAGGSYTDLVEFASSLNYDGVASNGNVVDFFVQRKLICDNTDKFLAFIKASISLGFFQMQMNIVSSEQLKEAKAHPERFPDLIVRVWGFSAYFIELPEEYQDMLIQRALDSEKS